MSDTLFSNLETKLVHAGRKPRYTQGSVNTVVQRASSLVFPTVADKKHATKNRYKGELFYGRRGLKAEQVVISILVGLQR